MSLFRSFAKTGFVENKEGTTPRKGFRKNLEMEISFPDVR